MTKSSWKILRTMSSDSDVGSPSMGTYESGGSNLKRKHQKKKNLIYKTPFVVVLNKKKDFKKVSFKTIFFWEWWDGCYCCKGIIRCLILSNSNSASLIACRYDLSSPSAISSEKLVSGKKKSQRWWRTEKTGNTSGRKGSSHESVQLHFSI